MTSPTQPTATPSAFASLAPQHLFSLQDQVVLITGAAGGIGGALARGSLTFVSQAGLAAGIGQKYGLQKTLSAVKGIRGVGKRHMVHNDYAPKMEVDAQTYAVRADGLLLTCEPAVSLPMTQRYFLF